jgi:hypothetical protein
MINVYFSHLTTNYEKPYDVRNFKMCIFTINYHGSFEISTNQLNLTTHLTINSLKKVTEKKLDHQIQQFYWPTHIFLHLITCTFAIRIYSHKSSWKDATWYPMAYEPFTKLQKNYIFIYFGMPLKMDDINVLFIFIFIQIDISPKEQLHMQL